jgi:hypothetical protein
VVTYSGHFRPINEIINCVLLDNNSVSYFLYCFVVTYVSCCHGYVFKIVPGEHNLVPVVFGVAFALFLLPGVCSGLIMSLKYVKQPSFMF